MRPPARAPGEAPGGLVFVLVDGAGVVLEAVPITAIDADGFADAADRHATACLEDPALRVVVYDGDTGEPAMVITRNDGVWQ